MLVTFRTSKILSAALAISVLFFLFLNLDFFGSHSLSPSLRTHKIETYYPEPSASLLAVTDSAANFTIPKKIWYKLGPKGLSQEAKGWINTCLTKNPTFRHEFLTDATGDTYVKEHYAERSDIIETYFALQIYCTSASLVFLAIPNIDECQKQQLL